MLSGFIGTENYNLTALQNNQKEINARKNEKDYFMVLVTLMERVILSIGLMILKIKIQFQRIVERYHIFYKNLEDIYEMNFIAGEEDAKLRERLRKKFHYSFFEVLKECEADEDNLLEATFENTVYNALYISERRQAQLDKMNFAPKINFKQIEHQKKSLCKESRKQNKGVTFNINEQAELNDTQQVQDQNTYNQQD
ncbi:hypothetical protein ABPG74_010094 [Tetrahymena malaccensis]